jgi:hypothetical protein
MRTQATLISLVAVLGLAAGSDRAAAAPRNLDRDGMVYRYYPGLGYRFQPLLSFGALNDRVSAHDAPGARRLASLLLAQGVRSGRALYWRYDFPFGGSAAGWTSGFAQAVAAQALARTGKLLRDPSFTAAGDAAFRGLRSTLLMPIGGGSWVREYSFTGQVILNAQLESILALDSYARVRKTDAARRVARDLEVAARTLLPRFEAGCWGLYELGGARADLHYQTYHVDLLRRMAARHHEPIWRNTYLRWRGCLS